MSEENRDGYAVFASGDAGTAKDVISIREEATFSIDNITITYNSAGTVDADVELYDDEEGTGEASLTGQFTEFIATPGTPIDISDATFEDVEDDVVVVVRNNDDDVAVSISGHLTTG